MDAPDRTGLDLEALVEHMFDQVLSAPDRVELLTWIRAWEDDNPDVDAAHRITGWIDVAYAFQARTRQAPAPRRTSHPVTSRHLAEGLRYA